MTEATVSQRLQPSLHQARLVTLAAALGWLFDSVVVNLFTVSLPQIESAFQLTSSAIGIISSLFLLGYAIGTLVGGTMADYIGRRTSLGLSIVLYTIFSGLTGFASSFGLLAASRFLTGVGAGTELPVGAAYVAEVAPAARRGLWIGAMNSVFSLGIFVAALVLAVLGDWHWAFFSTVAMGAIVLGVRSQAGESPRFVQVQKDIASGVVVRRRTTVGEVFAAQYRGRTLRVMLLWLGYWICWWSWSIFVPRFLTLRAGVPAHSVIQVMMVYALLAFLGQVFAGFISDVIGRRATIITASLCAIVAIWCWSVMAEGSIGIILGGISFALALMPAGVLLVYTTELFPTALRGTGQSMTIGIARLISVAAPALGGKLIASFGYGAEFRVVSTFLLITAVAAWYGPETAGRDLEDQETPRQAGIALGSFADVR